MVNKIPFFLENSNSLEGFLVWTNYDILSHSIADIIWQISYGRTFIYQLIYNLERTQ